MLAMPFAELIKKIVAASGLAEKDIRAKINAKVKELDGLVSDEGAAYIIASELGVRLLEDIEQQHGAIKIDKMMAGMQSVDIAGKVLRRFRVSTFKRKDKTDGRVGSILIGDETGKTRLVLWDDATALLEKISDGDVLGIKGAYVRESKLGGCELHLGKRGKLLINPPDVEIGKVSDAAPEVKRVKLAEAKNGDSVRASGTVVAVNNVNTYDVCPDCGKKAFPAEDGKSKCVAHGDIIPKKSMVFSFVLDDGSAALRCAAFRDQASRLTNVTADEADSADSAEVLRARIEDYLLGKDIEIEGRVKYNQGFDRTEIIVNDCALDLNPKLIAERLLQGRDKDNRA